MCAVDLEGPLEGKVKGWGDGRPIDLVRQGALLSRINGLSPSINGMATQLTTLVNRTFAVHSPSLAAFASRRYENVMGRVLRASQDREFEETARQDREREEKKRKEKEDKEREQREKEESLKASIEKEALEREEKVRQGGWVGWWVGELWISLTTRLLVKSALRSSLCSSPLITEKQDPTYTRRRYARCRRHQVLLAIRGEVHPILPLLHCDPHCQGLRRYPHARQLCRDYKLRPQCHIPEEKTAGGENPRGRRYRKRHCRYDHRQRRLM